MRTRSSVHQLMAAALLAGSLACASSEQLPPLELAVRVPAAEETVPLAGAGLEQRKQRMGRAYRDLVHFHKTLESLHYRADRSGLRRIRSFADAYIGLHVDPLLRAEWQSQHPEVALLDANLRFAKADVLIRMRQTGRAERVMDEIERRFQGREDLLVDYPVGEQKPLGQALRQLRDGKWRG